MKRKREPGVTQRDRDDVELTNNIKFGIINVKFNYIYLVWYNMYD